jgi:amino acid adenylation domain-containing protein
VIATFEKAIRSIITASSDTPITAVDIFSEHDQEMIWARNQTPSAPVELCVHEIIQQRCIEYPDSEAVCDTNGSFTYRELDELSSRLARYLTRECGSVAPNEVIPICLERTRWTPVAMLGVLKAGGTFLLMDTSYPHQRRMETCHKVNARIAVISSTHAATDEELASIVVLVGSGDCFWDKPGQNKDKTLLPKVQPDHALYVVFTSGSTGNPKGPVVDHRSYCTGARDHIVAWKLTRESRVTQFASYAFDMCVLEQLSVLMAGACICIVSDEQRNNLGEVASALKANFAMLVPSVARLFRPEDLPSIDTLMLGGECMTKTDVSSWAHYVRLLNGYGPSECSPLSAVQSTIYPTSDPRNVGHPIGCVFWVVDANDHNKLVPHGAIGELVIEGPIVGLGYINQPDQTAKAFIEPTAWLCSLRPQQLAGTHLYKTGDLVRTNSDGSLIIIGRKVRQVKVRGQRLELADVEAHVHRCFQGAALDVVAEMIAPAGTTKSQLVGLVLCQEQTENDEEDLVAEGSDILKAPSESFATQVAAVVIKLRQTVPDFMVPTIFLPLRQMPRTYSGKVDRNRLRNLIGSMSLEKLQVYRALSSSSSSATVTNGDRLSTNKERTLGDIWAQVLELPIDTISIHDNFFLRGGHSIDAMKVAALSRAAGMTLSVVDIFAHPILSDLAKAAVLKNNADAEGEDNSSQLFSLCPIDNPKALHAQLCAKGIIPSNSTLEDLLPATQAQDLFIKRETFHSYNWTIKDSSLDIGRIRAACQTLVDRYSILRTCFVEHEGRPLQMILGNFDAEILEFSCSQNEDPLDFSESLWDRTDSPTLDGLGASLPFRFTLVSRPGQKHVVLTLQISHAQWDGISTPRLFSDFASIFNQTPLPPTTDFAQYSYHRALPPQVQKEKHPDFQFWREYLDGAEMAVPFPPHAEPAAAEQSDESLWTVKGISPPPQLPAGVTMATLVKSASAFFLSHHLRQRDLVFGHTTNGRNLAMDNIESMLGCCLNFIPLRITFPESPTAAWTVRDLMDHVQNQYIRALPHEHVELREIFEHSTNWPAETPLNFIVQHQNIEFSYKLPLRKTVGVRNGDESDDDLLDVEFSRFARFKSLDEIWVFTEPHPDRLEVQICGNSRVLPQEKATDMSDKLCRIIEAFAANPEMKLEDIIL